MLIHHYNEISGSYLGTSEAIESPLEPGVWLVPAKATATTPPLNVDPFSLAWNGESWESAPEPEPEPIPDPVPEASAPVEMTPAMTASPTL